MTEQAIQTKLVKWLKEQGCEVLKTMPGMGIGAGFPDVLFLKGEKWGCLEVKKNKHSKFQPLQKQYLQKLDNMSYAQVIHADNYEEKLLEVLDFLSDN